MDKASDFGSEDCRFESCHGRHVPFISCLYYRYKNCHRWHYDKRSNQEDYGFGNFLKGFARAKNSPVILFLV